MSLPKHVAIIMDGNGRWAQRRQQPRVYGHVRGTSRVKAIIREANRLGIRALTLYAFSTENWKRPEAERRILWRLLKKYLAREQENLMRENVVLRVIGESERLDSDVRAVLDPVIQKLSRNTGLRLTFAISYGSRRELVHAARRFAEDCVRGDRKPSELTEEVLAGYLWTADLGELSDVDLVIRTSGEQRVSNFLLWQAAYAEFVFTDLCWPDFQPVHLQEAVSEFARRQRRFGGLLQPGMTV
jgi:undecaprenyl diphosphate synthase